jgi:type IV pilus assembly protein PilW
MNIRAPQRPGEARRSHARARKAGGFSLVEIMVSLVIGLVVIGAVFANYLNNSAGTRQAAALAQVAQDATLAMGILRNHITMAGYSRPNGVNATSRTMARLYSGQVIFGCTEGFDASTDNNASYDTITCNQASPPSTQAKPDALAILYEADGATTPLVGTTPTPTPSDCAGSGLVITGTAPNDFYMADNRFAIIPGSASTATTSATPPGLGCLGNGGVAWLSQLKNSAGANKTYQPLVENISDMRIWYGIANVNPTTAAIGNNVVQYLTGAQVAATAGGAWDRVIAVRVCLIARSSEQVLDQAQPYYDCAGNVVTPSDRYIYRAFKSTVVLNNRLGPLAN